MHITAPAQALESSQETLQAERSSNDTEYAALSEPSDPDYSEEADGGLQGKEAQSRWSHACSW